MSQKGVPSSEVFRRLKVLCVFVLQKEFRPVKYSSIDRVFHQLKVLCVFVLQKEFRPVKYFSIDRVFRNETLDATHLAEFHQIEGVVCDGGITLGDLIGLFSSFFKKLGMFMERALAC